MTYEEALQLVLKGNYAQADELIIYALRKQISKTPKYIGKFCKYKCPCCDTGYMSFGTNYCEDCGHKLNWDGINPNE